MDDFLNIMKALSDGTRLKIINLLLNYDYCVGALARNLNVSEAAVSQHLKVLRKAGIVAGEKRGYYTHYDVNKKLFSEAAEYLNSISAHETPRKGCCQHITGNHLYCSNGKIKDEKEFC